MQRDSNQEEANQTCWRLRFAQIAVNKSTDDRDEDEQKMHTRSHNYHDKESKCNDDDDTTDKIISRAAVGSSCSGDHFIVPSERNFVF